MSSDENTISSKWVREFNSKSTVKNYRASLKKFGELAGNLDGSVNDVDAERVNSDLKKYVRKIKENLSSCTVCVYTYAVKQFIKKNQTMIRSTMNPKSFLFHRLFLLFSISSGEE